MTKKPTSISADQRRDDRVALQPYEMDETDLQSIRDAKVPVSSETLNLLMDSMAGQIRAPADSRLNSPAMRTFSNIADKWALSERERHHVIGIRKDQEPTQETLERISHVFAIYRGVHTLLGMSERADRWMLAANTAPPFSGRRPVDLVIEGEVVAVRRYLEAQIHTSFA